MTWIDFLVFLLTQSFEAFSSTSDQQQTRSLRTWMKIQIESLISWGISNQQETNASVLKVSFLKCPGGIFVVNCQAMRNSFFKSIQLFSPPSAFLLSSFSQQSKHFCYKACRICYWNQLRCQVMKLSNPARPDENVCWGL